MALTSIQRVKRYLRIPLTDTTNDTLLDSLITRASERIETIAGRKFPAADYTEWASGLELGRMYVKNPPIIHLNRLAWGNCDALDVEYAGTDIEATVGVYSSTGVRLRSVAADGTTTANNLDFATYPTLSTMAAAITAVADWTATVVGDDAKAATLRPFGGQSAKARTATLLRPDEDEDDYDVEPESGRIVFHSERLGRDKQHVRYATFLIDYRGGYETIPGDIEQVAIEIVAEMFNMGARDTSLQSESLGDYSYTLAQGIELTQSQAAKLAPYRVIR